MTIAMTIATTIRMPHSMKARFGLRFDRGAGASPAAAAAVAVARTGPVAAAEPLPGGRRRGAGWGADDGGGFDVVGHRGCSTTPILADPTCGIGRGARLAAHVVPYRAPEPGRRRRAELGELGRRHHRGVGTEGRRAAVRATPAR